MQILFFITKQSYGVFENRDNDVHGRDFYFHDSPTFPSVSHYFVKPHDYLITVELSNDNPPPLFHLLPCAVIESLSLTLVPAKLLSVQ